MTTGTKYYTETRTTPGAGMTTVGRHATLRAARQMAREYSDRRDLTYPDVAIRRVSNDALVEYAGPAR